MTNQLFDLIKTQLSDQVMDQIGNQLGTQDRRQTAVATEGALNTLISALAKNVQQPGGAQSLFNAVERDHDGGGLLDNLMGFLTGGQQVQNNRSVDGLGILMHLLGNKTTGSVDMLSRMSGMDKNKTARLLITLAPVVLSALGKMKQQKQIQQPEAMQRVVRDTYEDQQRSAQNPTINLISKFLDTDNDGDIKNELAGMGMKLIGSFLRGR
ncbi:MAG: DUF937 domain-containing protein [Bacteroidota bacterium]